MTDPTMPAAAPDPAWSPAAGRYDAMVYRRCGRSGLQLPAVSLGLWQNFGADRPAATARAIVRRAVDLGVVHLDLANNYGPPYGAAETTFGAIVRADLRAHRDELLISTKAGYDMWPGPYGDGGSRKYLLASLDQSLRRMSLDYVDVFYHHRYDPATPLAETAGALHHAVTSGRALYVGVSNYPPERIREIAALLAGLGTPLTLVQPRYSMVDRRAEAGVFDAIEQVGAAAAVYSPLAQGRLTDRYLQGVPAGSRATRSAYLGAGDVTDELVRRARGLDAVARRHGHTLAQLAIAWVLRRPVVATAIIGASGVGQLAGNVGALGAIASRAAEDPDVEGFCAPPGEALPAV